MLVILRKRKKNCFGKLGHFTESKQRITAGPQNKPKPEALWGILGSSFSILLQGFCHFLTARIESSILPFTMDISAQSFRILHVTTNVERSPFIFLSLPLSLPSSLSYEIHLPEFQNSYKIALAQQESGSHPEPVNSNWWLGEGGWLGSRPFLGKWLLFQRIES